MQPMDTDIGEFGFWIAFRRAVDVLVKECLLVHAL